MKASPPKYGTFEVSIAVAVVVAASVFLNVIFAPPSPNSSMESSPKSSHPTASQQVYR